MAVPERDDIESLQHFFVCPVCKGRLYFSPTVVSCAVCGLAFVQSQHDCLDLLPDGVTDNDRSDWGPRQQGMEEWYRDLLTHQQWAVDCFSHDYHPYSSLLATLTGAVLDIGGGNGIVRHYLPESTRYIVIEPSLTWLGKEWETMAGTFPCVKARPWFVRGVGEYLPFPANCFDAVLAFWSLNHACCPAMVFQEAYRVLAPAGRFIVSLEDMPPRWADVIRPTFLTGGFSRVAKIIKTKVLSSLKGQEWPTQADHIRIKEAEIQQWITDRFAMTKRAWVKTYLTFEFRKA